MAGSSYEEQQDFLGFVNMLQDLVRVAAADRRVAGCCVLLAESSSTQEEASSAQCLLVEGVK